MPFDGAHPMVIQWPGEPFPGARMADLGCRLVRLSIEHPNANEIAGRLEPMFSDDRVVYREGVECQLSAEIQTPHGVRTLT